MKILAILGHPSTNSFNNALLESYVKGAKKNNQVKKLKLSELNFDPILHEGYKVRQELEPDLINAQKLIKWADKIVLVYPTWWTTPPALLKGFLERTFLSRFAFRFKSPYVREKLLKGKSARIIVTMDSPWPYYKFIVGNPGYKQIKGTLGFCGIRPIKKTYISGLKFKSEEQREKILQKVYNIGLKE